MMRKTFIIFLINLILLNPGLSYALETLSLKSLIEEAKARIPQAKSLDDPTVGLTFEKTPGSPFRLNKTMSEDRMLSISQMLPWFGKLPLKGKIALVESQMFAGDYKNKELEISNEVKKAYYDLFMNYKETALREEGLGFLKSTAEIAETRYIVGEITQEDIFKINLEIAKAGNDTINLKQEKLAKETRLNSVLSREPESPLGVPYLEEDVQSFDKDTALLYKLTLENQPELLVFSYAIEKNRYAKSLAKKSFFPDLMAGIVMRGITTGTIGPSGLMLAFTGPLWFWTKPPY